MPELADRRLVGNAGFPQIGPRKRPHRDHVVERFLDGWIAQVEPVLKEVDAQHPLQIDRPASYAFPLVIKGPDDLSQALPGNDPIHLQQKLRSPRRLRVALKTRCG